MGGCPGPERCCCDLHACHGCWELFACIAKAAAAQQPSPPPRPAAGYSGTAILSRRAPLSVAAGIGQAAHDGEGRVLTAEFDSFFLVRCACLVGRLLGWAERCGGCAAQKAAL